VLVQQGVDVAVPVGFCFDQQFVFLEGETGLVVQKGWDFLLFHYCELGGVQAEVVVLLQQLLCERFRIIRSHNSQGHFMAGRT
jgi:hypothetical protein